MPQVVDYVVTESATDAEIWTPVVLSSDTQITDGAMILVDASGGNRIIELPPAGGITGRILFVKKVDSSVNTVTVAGDGSETIDGDPDVTLTAQYDAVTLGSDGTEWFILALYP